MIALASNTGMNLTFAIVALVIIVAALVPLKRRWDRQDRADELADREYRAVAEEILEHLRRHDERLAALRKRARREIPELRKQAEQGIATLKRLSARRRDGNP
jgi:hypothetical protein